MINILFMYCINFNMCYRTLYKQGPYQGQAIIDRALIVTPSSLTDNWKKEFLHWLGRDRISVYAVNSTNTIEKAPDSAHVIIISYERESTHFTRYLVIFRDFLFKSFSYTNSWMYHKVLYSMLLFTVYIDET